MLPLRRSASAPQLCLHVAAADAQHQGFYRRMRHSGADDAGTSGGLAPPIRRLNAALRRYAITMGAFLDKPRTDKTNVAGGGDGLSFAVAAMQGWRVEMEDAHAAVVGLGAAPPLSRWAFFGVFDGHAGGAVAAHAADHLLAAVLDTDELRRVVADLRAADAAAALTDAQTELVRRGLRSGFLHFDESIRDDASIRDRSGSTAVCALVTPRHLFVANLGDSRAVLSKDGAVAFATDDHKPFMQRERDRIVKAGGSVMIQRVNGSLAVSRALGDFEYKAVDSLPPVEQLVSPEPDVYCLQRADESDEFVVLACDGLYDVMSNTELTDFVRSRMRVTDDLSAVANHALDACLAKGSRDNMSLIVLALPAAPTVDEAAVEADRRLRRELDQRVNEILAVYEHTAELEPAYVMRILSNQEIPGVPPGAGLDAMRFYVEELLEKVVPSERSSRRSSAAAASGGGGGGAVARVKSTSPSAAL